ncbi:MAG: hypothetical protein GEV28_20680 [Actinophytocola sp.]|nr:hypothetical protein [Actinophytocola sp.]MPZ82682.1 hypothetical protein [Actinophytocola sp.]
MWGPGVAAWWHAAYRRVVRSSFATVPLYRERWALDGRTDPVLVAGRAGFDGGAVSSVEIAGRMADLVPIGGGEAEVDRLRGLGFVLPPLGDEALVVVLDTTGPRPPADLPRGVRGCVLDPDRLRSDGVSSAVAAVTSRLRRGGPVLAVGSDKHLARLVETLPAEDAVALDRLPVGELDQLDAGPFGVLHDQTLGFLGSFGECGRWHVDWRRVHVRETAAGLAFTLLRQRSPRLVDVLVGGGVRGRVGPCPRHATPVLLT